MLIVFNWRAVACCAAAIGVGLYLHRIGKSDSLIVPAAGLVLIGTDCTLRLARRTALRRERVSPLAISNAGADPNPRFAHWYLPTAGGHVWFIPVWVLGLVTTFVSAVLAYDAAHRTPNPARDSFEADQQTLGVRHFVSYPEADSAQQLSAYFEEHLVPELAPREFHVLTRVTEARALILVRAPCLDKLANSARKVLLTMIEEQANSLFPKRQLFIGVSGSIYTRIIETPAAGTQLEASEPTPLWAFYAPLESLTKSALP